MSKIAEVLLLAQGQPGRPVAYKTLRDRWGLTERQVRRIANQAVELSSREEFKGAGRLEFVHRPGPEGPARSGLEGAVVWRALEAPEFRRRSHAVAARLAALPFEAAGAEQVVQTLLKLSEQEIRPEVRPELEELWRHAFWYQPAAVKTVDPMVVKAALEALVLHRPLLIREYASPTRHSDLDVVLEPWTLVHSYDGLYLLGLDRADRDGAPRRPMALHRMSGAEVLRDQSFQVPGGYNAAAYLDHGFGPFLGREGNTVIFVPEYEWGWVREVKLPHQFGEPREVEGGVEVTLGVGFNFGMPVWCRWMGVKLVSSTGAPERVLDRK